MNSNDKSREKVKEISDWQMKLTGELPALELVEAIKVRRRAAAPGEDEPLASALDSALLGAASALKWEADAVIDEMIERLPDDVLFPIAKANLHLHHLAGAEEALEASDEALARSERTGLFLRDVLELRAQIFHALGWLDKHDATLATLSQLQDRLEVAAPACDELELETERDEIAEIFRWGEDLRRELPPLEAVEAIKARRREGAPGEDRALAQILYGQLLHAAASLQEEAEAVIDEMIERLPDDVRFPIAKVSLHHYFTSGPERALECSEVALARAERTGFFRREVLGMRARIFRDLGRFDELNATLDAIMALEMKRDIPDIPRERDFVDHAPPGAIRPDVLERYNAFRPKREGD